MVNVNTTTFERAMQAALKGPEVKKLKLVKHEFNVKPVKATQNGSGLEVKGHISHHLTWSDDDQVHFRFRLVPGKTVTIDDVAIDIDRSVVRRALKLLWDEVLKDLLTKTIGGGVTGAGLDRSAVQTTVKDVFEESKKQLDGSWEGEVRMMILNIAARLGLGVAATARPSGTAPRTTARLASGAVDFARRLSVRTHVAPPARPRARTSAR